GKRTHGYARLGLLTRRDDYRDRDLLQRVSRSHTAGGDSDEFGACPRRCHEAGDVRRSPGRRGRTLPRRRPTRSGRDLPQERRVGAAGRRRLPHGEGAIGRHGWGAATHLRGGETGTRQSGHEGPRPPDPRPVSIGPRGPRRAEAIASSTDKDSCWPWRDRPGGRIVDSRATTI